MVPPPPDAKDELRFLAALVHRGQATAAEAEGLVAELQAGGSLDELLVAKLGREEDWVARMRRTNAGEIPEVPGYEIGERLGVGGTATVWAAVEKKTGTELALKVLKPEVAAKPSELKAFVEEAKLLGGLDHPGLVKSFGVARSGSTIFNRLELIPGRTLLERLDAVEVGHSPFDEGIALAIVLEVARALEHLEENGIVHRDIKPGNIMITDGGAGAAATVGDERVVLIDLGFAAEAGAAGKADSTAGTVAYLSPEQAQGGAAADARSDIYSLGVSLFQLAVGRLPFDSSDDREVLRMQVMESLQSPELKGRGFSPHLQYFIEKMMSKEAGDRYQSFAELIEDIAGQLEGRDDLDFRSGATERRPRAGRGRAGGAAGESKRKGLRRRRR